MIYLQRNVFSFIKEFMFYDLDGGGSDGL